MKRRPPVAVLLGLLLAACSGPILANPPLVPIAPPTPTHGPTRAPDPVAIVFPRDDAPHDRLTEWWYVTGHLAGEDGRRFGFEAVVFRAERGGFPVSWASHLALTHETAGEFRYAQRAYVGPDADRSLRGADGIPQRFDLVIPEVDAATGSISAAEPWMLSGAVGGLTIQAQLSDTEAVAAGGGFALTLAFPASGRPPALHGGSGWLDFGPAGGSYYYSLTRLVGAGVLALDGADVPVTGIAWFDHQWGDFISVGGGGWDWFAVNLDDGTDLTISLVRAADGSYPLVYGTLVDADGRTTNLEQTAFELEADPARTWTSPASGATYPAGWTIRIPGEGLVIDLEPTVAAQELDTRATTGVVYWEGSQTVTATRDGVPVGGEAYVELTGYAPAVP
jgi:predicted secreted hydrolase